MEEYFLWLIKATTVLLVSGLAFTFLVVAINNIEPSPGKIVIRNLNKYYASFAAASKLAGIKKEEDAAIDKKGNVYVITFKGDVAATEVSRLREEVTAILQVATSDDIVVANITSSGGMVHSYGFAASQLLRIKGKNIPLTVCVDHVAASGGYMMACVADTLVAAPFAIIGSIGVVAQMPNLHKWLKARDIDYDLYTAGDYKRTVTMFGENTEEGQNKFREQLQETHQLFKDFVSKHRDLDIEAVATGETWYGSEAVEQKLVDMVGTSDDILQNLAKDYTLYQYKYVPSKTWAKKMGESAQACIASGITQFLSGLHTKEIIKL